MIGIVTVLYNSELVLEDFFFTLNKQTYKDFVLYLVDNKSTDNSVEVGKKYATQVEFECKWYIQNENLGVAEGNNIGIKAALKDGCDYILLSNNDIVLKGNTIQTLLDGLTANNATMAVPKIYYWDNPNKIWMAGGGFKRLILTTYHRGINIKDSGQFDKIDRIEYAPTCFMLIKASLFSHVGYMDKDYFVYYDDSDFIWRSVIIKKQALIYIPNSVIWHKVSSSTGGITSDFSVYYMNRNHIYFALKFCRGFNYFIFIFFQIVYSFYYFIFKYKRKAHIKIAIKAMNDGYRLYKKNKPIKNKYC